MGPRTRLTSRAPCTMGVNVGSWRISQASRRAETFPLEVWEMRVVHQCPEPMATLPLVGKPWAQWAHSISVLHSSSHRRLRKVFWLSFSIGTRYSRARVWWVLTWCLGDTFHHHLPEHLSLLSSLAFLAANPKALCRAMKWAWPSRFETSESGFMPYLAWAT